LAGLVALARVYLGIHYPGDVLVGALIGVATSVAVNREAIRRRIAAPILALEPRYTPYFYGLFFLVSRVPSFPLRDRGHGCSLAAVDGRIWDEIVSENRCFSL